MKSNTSVSLKEVNKKYEIHHEKPTLVERFMNHKNETFWALKRVSLKIFEGERIGIVGANGSGKTTLLKIITGITTPTSGLVKTNGKIVSLIDLEAGFHPDLTGIQNIFLNGAILGISKKEIKNKLKEIVKFANIGKFIDIPLFTYSQGMKLRLGFSIAVHAEPDILILDENISVGDQDFSKISNNKVQQLFKDNKTIIIASHDMDFIEENCDRVIWIDSGKIKMDGPAKRVITNYRKYSK